MKSGQNRQSLFRTFIVPTHVIPRSRAEVEEERKEGQRRLVDAKARADYQERKQQLAKTRRNRKAAN